MNLPDYFLADLPKEASLTPTVIAEACQTLKRNRETYLAGRSTIQMVHTIDQLARDWLDSKFPFRLSVLEQGPAATGFSRATLAAGLDAFFAQLTAQNLRNLIRQDLGDGRRLDELVRAEADEPFHRAALARGSELLVHISGGRLPNPTLACLVLGLLTRSAQFLKCAENTSFIPRMFAHSLYAVEPKLGACLELAEWKGGTEPLEAALFAEADTVTVTGSDATLEAIRNRLPVSTRFVGYGHRVSFGFIAREALAGPHAPKTAARAARDVAAWDQCGCLSPHVIYVETGGNSSPEEFAQDLAGQLDSIEQTQPRGPLSPVESGAITTRRHFFEVRAAHLGDTLLWCSRDSTAWTVVFDSDPRFQSSCLNRFIFVKAVADLELALQGADAIRRCVSTVGLAAPEDRAKLLAEQLAGWGASRVCPLGQMQDPPLTWRHDGRPSLADLVTWTDWEF